MQITQLEILIQNAIQDLDRQIGERNQILAPLREHDTRDQRSRNYLSEALRHLKLAEKWEAGQFHSITSQAKPEDLCK